MRYQRKGVTLLPRRRASFNPRERPQFQPRWRDEVEELLSSETMDVHRDLLPMVLLLMGRRGHGKSLSMVGVAKILHDYWKAKGIKRRVLSNNWIAFADYSDPHLVERLLANPYFGEESLICIDEIGSAFPGRRAMSSYNVEFAIFLQQMRKLRCDIIATTQHPQVLDYQVLLQVDLFGRCYMNKRDGIVKVGLYDWWGQFTGKDWRKPWPPRVGEEDDWKIIRGLKQIYPLYKSEEIVPYISGRSREGILNQQWDFTEQRAAIAEQQIEGVHEDPPKTLLEYLDRTAPQIFNLMAFLGVAREFEKDTVHSRRQFADFLEARGYAIIAEGGQLFAGEAGGMIYFIQRLVWVVLATIIVVVSLPLAILKGLLTMMASRQDLGLSVDPPIDLHAVLSAWLVDAIAICWDPVEFFWQRDAQVPLILNYKLRQAGQEANDDA